MANRVFSVTELNEFIKHIFDANSFLKRISVEGEITNLVRASSGHYYFSLKDATSEIRCIMWRSSAERSQLKLRDGLNVKVNGAVQVYVQRGQYSIIVSTIHPAGIGTLYQIYVDRLKDLEKKGYFKSEIKKELPEEIKTIGVVTSESGAVIHDIITTANRLNPSLEIILKPALVQGEGAKESIAEGIKALNKIDRIDAIIVGRGGGSLEDLWAFNELEVAEAVYNSNKPIISSVGHETDVTISDMVADLRAPTPTAAAEIVSFGYGVILGELDNLENRIVESIVNLYNNKTIKIQNLTQRLKALSPENKIMSFQFKVDELDLKIHHLIEKKLEYYKNKLEALKLKIDLLSPTNILDRGYVMVTGENGRIVKSVFQAKEDKILNLHFSDGEERVEVIDE